MQPSHDHHPDLHHFLRSTRQENTAHTSFDTYSLRSRVDWPAVTAMRSNSSAARPPQPHPTTAVAVAAAAAPFQPRNRGGRPPPAPRSTREVPREHTAVTSSRHVATKDDINQYLAHRQQDGADFLLPIPEQRKESPSNDHRRAKRGKPMARRSLQSLFDAAAEDSSTWQTTSISTGDTEDDEGDNAVFLSSYSTGQLHRQESLLRTGPNTPATADNNFSATAILNSPTDSCPHIIDDTTSLESLIPLPHLLMSDRGRTLSALEVKAIITRIAQDLHTLHEANAVHRCVSLDSIRLVKLNDFPDADLSVATLLPGCTAASLGAATRVYWAVKENTSEEYCASEPPEVACCPNDRPVAYTPAGDMWGLGIVLFGLLSAGRIPFEEEGFLCGSATVDALQRRLALHLAAQIQGINGLMHENSVRCSSGNNNNKSVYDDLGMNLIGFDAQAQSLLQGLLHADPAQRLSAAEVLRHPWLSDVIPLVPKIQTALPMHLQTRSAGKREETPPLSDVVRKTEQLDLIKTNATTAVTTSNPNAVSIDTALQHSNGCMFAVNDQECPYPIIGHVAQPIEVVVAGQKVTAAALHAVYSVPGHGAMMSAAPVAIADPADVEAAVAAAASNTHLGI